MVFVFFTCSIVILNLPWYALTANFTPLLGAAFSQLNQSETVSREKRSQSERSFFLERYDRQTLFARSLQRIMLDEET